MTQPPTIPPISSPIEPDVQPEPPESDEPMFPMPRMDLTLQEGFTEETDD